MIVGKRSRPSDRVPAPGLPSDGRDPFPKRLAAQRGRRAAGRANLLATALAGAAMAVAGPAAASVLSNGNTPGLFSQVYFCSSSPVCVDTKTSLVSPATDAVAASAVDGVDGYNKKSASGIEMSASGFSRFGTQAVEADAYAADPFEIDVGAKGDTDTYDLFDGAANSGGAVTVNFRLDGSLSPPEPYGATYSLSLHFVVYDITTQSIIENYSLSENEFFGPMYFSVVYNTTAGDELGIESDFQAATDVSSDDYDEFGHHVSVSANVSLSYSLVGPAGSGDIFGESGHDYTSLPTVPPTVPEPSTWAMLLAGFAGFAGLASVASRRRRLEAALG